MQKIPSEKLGFKRPCLDGVVDILLCLCYQFALLVLKYLSINPIW